MSMIANRTRLATLTKILVNEWHNTKEHWQDKQALKFEKEYIDGLLHEGQLEPHLISQRHGADARLLDA